MQHLFATWRINYILAPKHEGCIFCDFQGENRDDERYILFRGGTCFVMMNLYPYNPGHVMIVPYRHTADYTSLSIEELTEIEVLSVRSIKTLKKAFKPDGFNLGVNLGLVAGAGVADHLHRHIVPRWNGDTNFIAVVADMRVVPESHEATFKKLKEAWND
jgi:ATP adenylyltransferase